MRYELWYGMTGTVTHPLTFGGDYVNFEAIQPFVRWDADHIHISTFYDRSRRMRVVQIITFPYDYCR